VRDPARIDAAIERLRAVWKRHPDSRLGQLVAYGAKFGPDIPVHLIEVLLAAIEEVHT
jgi:hypothetical protein